MTMPGHGSGARDLDYLDHLASESARFAIVMAGTAPEARVPTCPDWTADDLLWHLGEVQWFWGTIVRERSPTLDEAESAQHPSGPSDRAGLVEFYANASRDLSAIARLDPAADRGMVLGR